MGACGLGLAGLRPRACVCVCCWGLLVARCSFSLAFRRQHVLGSPVQLQGRDGADVFGELGFPPHQRPLPPLLLLDLRGGGARDSLVFTD